ncbi:hypothetical protein [Chryseobacterium tongliaoense]|uniref:hypothetical protein n=1 Tax=Chryseobacterium tongliaoense TaxID=3240933 RepID=UPI00351680B3
MLDKNIDTEVFFKLSSEYIKNILKDEEVLQELKESCEDEDLQLINKSVTYVLYHKNELFLNSYEIKINIECKRKDIGSYVLYLDKDQNFIDEFFVVN